MTHHNVHVPAVLLSYHENFQSIFMILTALRIRTHLRLVLYSILHSYHDPGMH